MRCKKCLSSLAVFIGLFIILSSFPAYAKEYSEQYPAYLNPSGGCYVECQTNLGKGTFIVPLTYQKNTIGFYGNGNNLMNVTNTTVSGTFYLTNGRTYNIRASGFNTFQYQTEDGYGRYSDLTVTEIYNTNCFFVDDKLDRQNDKFDFDVLTMVNIMLLAVVIIILFLKISKPKVKYYG